MGGQQVGSLAGGLLGLALAPTGLGPLGFMIGSAVGGMAGGMLFPMKGPHTTVTGPRLGDLSVQASSYGGPIPIIYGTFGQLAGNVIWATDIIETSHTTSTTTGGGGKGGPPAQTTTTTNFTYSVSLAIALAAGPIGGVKRVWANGKLVWDAANPVAGGVVEGFRVYFGDETQVADPTIESDKGVGNVPGYRGLAYCVLTNWQLAPFQNAVPNLTFELIGGGTPYISNAGTVTTGQSAYPPYAAIDTATGLVWLSHFEAGTAEVIIIRPDTWTIVKRVPIPGASSEPRTIIYQPQYIHAALNESNVLIELTTASGTLVSTPARMWVGNSNDVNNVWFIDTDTYHVTEMLVDAAKTTAIPRVPNDGVWPGSGSLLWSSSGMAIDTSPIDSSNDVSNSPVRIVAGSTVRGPGTNPVSGAVGVYYVDFFTINTTLESLPFGFGLGTAAIQADGNYLPMVYNSSLTGSGCLNIADYTVGDGCIYVIDATGAIFQLTGMNVSASYTTNATAGGFNNLTSHITYDTAEGFVYASMTAPVGGHSLAIKLSADLSTLVWTRDFTSTGSYFCDDIKYQRGSGQLIATCHDAVVNAAGGRISIHILNPVDGTDADAWSTNVTSSTDGFSLPYPNASFVVFNGDYINTEKIPTVPVATGTTTLAAVITDLSSRAGLTAGDIDVSSLTAVLVDGYAVTTRTTVRSAIEPLQRGYFFDGMESDNKVKFILRGTSSVVTIPSTDVAAYEEGAQPPDPLSQVRAQEVDLPHQIEVSYLDSAADYRTVTQYSRRLIGSTQEKQAVQLPISATGAHAILVANVLLYDAWTSRMTYTFTVARKYAYLDPTDVITYQDADGTLTTMRITRVDHSLPLLLKFDAVREDTSVYAGFFTTTGSGGYVVPTITSAVPMVMHLGDWPIFRDGDNNPGFYVAANGVYSGWVSGQVFRSLDMGASYANFVTMTSEATVGTASTVLATTAKPEVWDDTNTVDIDLQTGSIATAANDLAVYAGGNAAMLGSELIQFGTVTSLGGGSYRLSHLLRGRNGTEWAVATHAVGDSFVVITSFTEIVRVNPGLDDVNLSRFYKGVVTGQFIADVATHEFTNTGVGMKPYAPASAAGTRDASHNFTATWKRRSRISGAWADAIDVPLGEDTESYSIDILSGSSSGATVRRTITASTQSASYTATMQTTDGFSAGQTLTYTVYQVSAQIGRGYGATVTVSASS